MSKACPVIIRALPVFDIRARYLASGHSSDRKSSMDNSAALRAMRKGEDVADLNEVDSADYRYRGGGSDRGQSPLDLWGDRAVKAEKERQAQNAGKSFLDSDASEVVLKKNKKKKKRFASFFDEVDELVEQRQREKRQSFSSEDTSLASLLDALENYESDKKGSTDKERRGLLNDSNTFNASSDISGETGNSNLTYSAVKARSIFDLEPDAPCLEPMNPNAYDRFPFEQYERAIKEVDQDRMLNKQTRKLKDEDREDFIRPVLKWIMRHDRSLPYSLPTLNQAVLDGAIVDGEAVANNLHSELEKQREAFLAETGLTLEQHEAAARGMIALAQLCAKKGRAGALEVAWEKIKEAGIIPDGSTMSTYLYVVGNGGSALSALTSPFPRLGGRALMSLDSVFGRRSASNDSEERESESEVTKLDLPEEVALFHDILYKPSESSISLRVRSLIGKGDAQGAEALMVKFASDGGTERLRAYLPVLNLYCEKGDISSGLKLFKRMRNAASVILEAENYVLLISAMAENGYFRKNSNPIDGAIDLGYSVSCGPKLFDEIVQEMAEDVLEVSSASARRLYNALAIGFKDEHMARNLKEMHSLAGMAHLNKSASANELVASRVTVDEKTAICPRTGATLRLIMLEQDEKSKLKLSLQELASIELVKFSKGKADSKRAVEELDHFADWLDTQTGKPFTAIVDGANVAYYMQNFDSGKFNYHQIQFVVDALLKMKETPLVVVPYKYGFNSFRINTGAAGEVQRLNEEERKIRDTLLENGTLYRVPKMLLDDYYWMLASVSDQTMARKGTNLDVAPQNEDGRWPGIRPILVSNDQMRDHKLQLMEPRLFRRWHSCHIMNYNFTAFVDDECVDNEIAFSTADFFSREIQSNPTSSGTAWHFPVSDWDLDDRLVIRIPSTNGGSK